MENEGRIESEEERERKGARTGEIKKWRNE